MADAAIDDEGIEDDEHDRFGLIEWKNVCLSIYGCLWLIKILKRYGYFIVGKPQKVQSPCPFHKVENVQIKPIKS